MLSTRASRSVFLSICFHDFAGPVLALHVVEHVVDVHRYLENEVRARADHVVPVRRRVEANVLRREEHDVRAVLQNLRHLYLGLELAKQRMEALDGLLLHLLAIAPDLQRAHDADRHRVLESADASEKPRDRLRESVLKQLLHHRRAPRLPLVRVVDRIDAHHVWVREERERRSRLVLADDTSRFRTEDPRAKLVRIAHVLRIARMLRLEHPQVVFPRLAIVVIEVGRRARIGVLRELQPRILRVRRSAWGCVEESNAGQSAFPLKSCSG
jgi:hypothetical protein